MGSRLAEFTARVRDHQAGLRAFIRSLGVQPEWVDDIAQEAFLVAWRELGRFEDDRDFGKWIRGIAKYLVLNERRKEARRSRILSDSLTDILQAQAGDERPDPAVDRSVAGALRDCLAQLPERSRRILVCRYAQDQKAPDLARTFQTSAEAARQALVRIRRLVRDCVEKKIGEAIP